MKHTIILIAILFHSCISSNAQITLAGSLGPVNSQAEIVNLSLSGKKIMIESAISSDTLSPTQIDTINFYNLDFSFWKRIICPYVPGYKMYSAATGGTSAAVLFYPSETLFNTDPLLEVAVCYEETSVSGTGKILIINETGAIVDSITNMYWGGASYLGIYNSFMRIYEVDTLGIGFQAVVKTPTGFSIYNLPGTLPCSLCDGNGLGVAKIEKSSNGIQTQPLPNPSSNQVKITFTLPQGINQANLVLYSTTGQLIKSFVVDNRFGYILLDESQLSPGVYYYNIEANGIISSTQKMVVIK